MSNTSGKNRIGIWPGILAGLSILTCYGTLKACGQALLLY